MSITKFNWLLREKAELTQEMLAILAGTSRAHLNQVLNNMPGRGHQTRKKLVRLVWTEGHANAGERILTDEMLNELGWDENGKLLHSVAQPVRGTFPVEQISETSRSNKNNGETV